MGIKNKLVSMTIYPKDNCTAKNGHAFCVIDTDYEINPYNPEKWSEDTVVVDMWSHTIAKAKDATNYFITILKPDLQKERVCYTSVFE